MEWICRFVPECIHRIKAQNKMNKWAQKLGKQWHSWIAQWIMKGICMFWCECEFLCWFCSILCRCVKSPSWARGWICCSASVSSPRASETWSLWVLEPSWSVWDPGSLMREAQSTSVQISRLCTLGGLFLGFFPTCVFNIVLIPPRFRIMGVAVEYTSTKREKRTGNYLQHFIWSY